MEKLKTAGLIILLALVSISIIAAIYYFLGIIFVTRDVIGAILAIGIVLVGAFIIGTRIIFAQLKMNERKLERTLNHIDFLERRMQEGFDFQKDLDLARIKAKTGGRPPIEKLRESLED